MPICPNCSHQFSVPRKSTHVSLPSPYRDASDTGREIPWWANVAPELSTLSDEQLAAALKLHQLEGDVTFYLTLPDLSRAHRLQLSGLLLQLRHGSIEAADVNASLARFREERNKAAFRHEMEPGRRYSRRYYAPPSCSEDEADGGAR